MAQGQICCSYSHKKCKVKYTTKHGTCVSHMLLMTRGYSFYIRIFTILAFVFHCVFACLFILILQNHIYLCWQNRQPRQTKNRGKIRKKRMLTHSQRTSPHWSLQKLSDMCLPVLFFPLYSNCSMDGNRKSSQKHRGWICAFLFSITFSSDSQKHT